MKKNIQWAIVAAAWFALAGIWLWEPSSPLIYIEPGRVDPAQVKAGQEFIVYRTFVVTRDENVSVSRLMIIGDCRKDCAKVNLPSSDMFLKKGAYANNGVPYIVPLPARPGIYKLIFTVKYQDRFGRWYSSPLPVLQLEVIP